MTKNDIQIIHQDCPLDKNGQKVGTGIDRVIIKDNKPGGILIAYTTREYGEIILKAILDYNE